MKKIFVFLMIAISLLSMCAVSASADESGYFSDEQKAYYAGLGLEGQTINVYNWGEYISDGEEGSMDVVKEFEALTGCTVNYSNFESNENMYSKLSGGGASYDVIIPSDYMIEKLIEEDGLLELDYSNIPNYDKYIADEYKGLYYDEAEKFTVPYNVGYTILIYNKNYFDEAPTSWEVLWDEQYKDKVLMFNNPRDAFAIAMSRLGMDYNTTNEADWEACADLLIEQRKAVNPEYVMDEIFDKMCSGDYALATYYAGDYVLMAGENEDLGYCFPTEGVNAFYDAMCIPKCAQNKKGAEAFINFMQEPEVALANAEYIYYASPNTSVMTNPEYSLLNNEAVYPAKKPVAQYFKNLPQKTLDLESKLWTNVKGDNSYFWVYIMFGVVVVAVVAFIIVKSISNKKKSLEQDI